MTNAHLCFPTIQNFKEWGVCNETLPHPCRLSNNMQRYLLRAIGDELQPRYLQLNGFDVLPTALREHSAANNYGNRHLRALLRYDLWELDAGPSLLHG